MDRVNWHASFQSILRDGFLSELDELGRLNGLSKLPSLFGIDDNTADLLANSWRPAIPLQATTTAGYLIL